MNPYNLDQWLITDLTRESNRLRGLIKHYFNLRKQEPDDLIRTAYSVTIGTYLERIEHIRQMVERVEGREP